MGTVAAVLVVPEARCWMHLDKCPVDAGADAKIQQNGISGAASVQVGGTLSVQNSVGAPATDKVTQTGISASGPVVVGRDLIIGNTVGAPAEEDCSKPYLQMQLDDQIGILVMGPGDDAGSHPRRFRVLVGNPTKACTAIVKSIFLQVVDVVADHHPMLEALTACYVLKAEISPADKGKDIGLSNTSRNYTPLSAPDQFMVDVFSKQSGVAYGLRFGVAWSDLKTGTANRTLSWVAFSPFPDAQGELFGGDNSSTWRREQLTQWRAKYDQADKAVADAKTADPGYPIDPSPECSPTK